VTSILERTKKLSRRRRRHAARSHQRLDIQGLRMVAVLTVFANHLWNWPRGGFIGVDVFFVISGFLITGNLLRRAEDSGNVSFRDFYWKRVRRIVPAATVVLILTYAASVLVFLPFKSHKVGVDALWAFGFLANWHFAAEGTDYFNAGDAVSPLQHYWSLSIEEQFYFVWPALIFVVGVLVVRKAWTHGRRMWIAGGVMGVIVAASLAWAMHETVTAPTWAYFNTFSRVWELGVGALLATAVGLLDRIPRTMKPCLSWIGLAAIGASLYLIQDGSVGFPAPWALLPVAGAALVVAAGVGGEPRFQGFLRNPFSTYIGDISYSLYLVHWPVIVLLGALVDRDVYFYATVVALTFGLTIASYHFVEMPLRRGDWGKLRSAVTEFKRGRYRPQRSSRYGAVAAVFLVTVAMCILVMKPTVAHSNMVPDVEAAPNAIASAASEPKLGPAGTALQGEILQALKATEWPELNPSIESVISGPNVPPDISACDGAAAQNSGSCTWGSNSAKTRVVVVGDSIAMTYAVPLKQIALNSGGTFQVHTEATFGCEFIDDLLYIRDDQAMAACPGEKQHAIDFINTTKPDVVIISNTYLEKRVNGSDQNMTPSDWGASITRIVDKIRGSARKIVFLAAPPADANINVKECYAKRSSTPASCVNGVTPNWHARASVEQDLAKTFDGTWIDSRPWFCYEEACPSFASSTPTKWDDEHMASAFGMKIAPVIGEALQGAGVF
jgi:peptidoglycan/LPS O-acetylase OafA/YrhL